MSEFESKVFDGVAFCPHSDEIRGHTFADCRFEGCGLTLRDPIEELTIRDMQFDHCSFVGCGLNDESLARGRSVILKNVEMTNCRTSRAFVGPHRFVESRIVELTVGDVVFFQGTMFEHVSIEGKTGALKLTQYTGSGDPDRRTPAEQQLVERTRLIARRFYQGVDWAVDISDADLATFDCGLIPAEKIRVNGEHQVRVNYAKTLEMDSQGDLLEVLGPSGGQIQLGLDLREDDQVYLQDSNFIFTTSPRKKRFEDDLRCIQAMRDSGLLLD